MTVLLHCANDLPDNATYQRWFTIGPSSTRALNPTTKAADIPHRLERAFETAASHWLSLTKSLSEDSSATLSHTASAAANISDFGVMLAWSQLVANAAAEPDTTLVVCDDPWMFRHIETLSNVIPGTKPPLFFRTLALSLRGVLARTKVALYTLLAWARTRHQSRRYPKGDAALLVYGHPTSTVDGIDGYFGPLMRDITDLARVLHVDCPPRRAIELAKDGRTFSLHAWGTPLDTISLPFVRWRPNRALLKGPCGWLVRRAAALEGSGGQGAMIAWQQRCQQRWLNSSVPRTVAWPWENHAWEKDFVRAAHRVGVHTIGYQHSVIGQHMLNYSANANHDGANSLPNFIFCTGPSTVSQLIRFGMNSDRLRVGGALRFPTVGPQHFDPLGPIFIALPFDQNISAEMISAARHLLAHGFTFVVKDHPMAPFEFAHAPGLVRTQDPLNQQGGLSAVLYAATTVGLESYLGGLPTIRFLSEERMALDIMPQEICLPTASSVNLHETLSRVAEQYRDKRPTLPSGAHFFAAVPLQLWRKELHNG